MAAAGAGRGGGGGRLPSGGSHGVAAFPPENSPREPELKFMVRFRPAVLPGSHDRAVERAVCSVDADYLDRLKLKDLLCCFFASLQLDFYTLSQPA